MNAYAEKVEIIQWVAGLEDKTTLLQLKKIKEESLKHQDWWESISEEERFSIERGSKDSEEGRVTPHAEVRKRYEKWL